MKKVFFLLLFLPLLSACARTAGNFDNFAQCLTEKGVIMYGSDTCPHCQNQKKMFEGSFDLVKYIECRKTPDVCEKAGITGYPTWFVNGKYLTGVRSFSELSEESGCPLSEPSVSE